MMLVGVACVKNDADVIGLSLSHLFAEGVNHVLIAFGPSTDRTFDMLENFPPATLTLTPQAEGIWYQGAETTALARRAWALGADWVIPFDADELWYAPDGRRLVDVLATVPPDIAVATAPMFRQFGGWKEPNPKPLPKVAFRPNPLVVVAEGNHDVSGIAKDRVWFNALEIRELQYRSLEHLRRKTRDGALMAAARTDLPDYGTHNDRYVSMTDAQLEAEWLAMSDRSRLVCDPIPSRSWSVTMAMQD
jgi:hypothetical protein